MPDLPSAVARCEPHARFNSTPSSTDPKLDEGARRHKM
jgi:hypothetical protein